jgi:hypothetical protein
MRRYVALTLTTMSMLVMTVATAGAQEPVGGCPNGTWELIGADNYPLLESLDHNADGLICRQPSRTPEGSPHSGVTLIDNNRRIR